MHLHPELPSFCKSACDFYQSCLVRAAAVTHVCDLAAGIPVSVCTAVKLVLAAKLALDAVEGAEQQNGKGVAQQFGREFWGGHGSGAAQPPRAVQLGLAALEDVLHRLDALAAVVHYGLQRHLKQLARAPL